MSGSARAERSELPLDGSVGKKPDTATAFRRLALARHLGTLVLSQTGFTPARSSRPPSSRYEPLSARRPTAVVLVRTAARADGRGNDVHLAGRGRTRVGHRCRGRWDARHEHGGQACEDRSITRRSWLGRGAMQPRDGTRLVCDHGTVRGWFRWQRGHGQRRRGPSTDRRRRRARRDAAVSHHPA